MAVQYAPTKLRVPPGFQNLLEGLAREVLREQPDDIIQFGAQYFRNQLVIREETGKDDTKRGENLEKLQKGEDVDIDLNDPEVQKAATKIQASFRGHLTREQMKQQKEEEEAALKIQASFRGHKAREEVKELKESRSRESAEASPAATNGTAEAKEADKPKEEEVDIDLNDPDVQGAAVKIQASFRGHKAREEIKKAKSSESVGEKKEAEPEGEATAEATAAEPGAPTTELEAAEPDAVATEPAADKEGDEVDIDLNDPEVQNAALIIQSSFRSHKSRESIRSVKEEEAQQKQEDEGTPATEDSAVEPANQDVAEPPGADAAQENAEEIDIDLDDPEVNKAATKIQATFRGHKTRKDMTEGSGSSASLKTPAEGGEAALEGAEPQEDASAVADAPQEQEVAPAEDSKREEAAPEGEGEVTESADTPAQPAATAEGDPTPEEAQTIEAAPEATPES